MSYLCNFYVYGYFDPSSGIPFYIGKGQGNRAWIHLTQSRWSYTKFYRKLRTIPEDRRKDCVRILKIKFDRTRIATRRTSLNNLLWTSR